MNSHADQSQASKSQSVANANAIAQKQGGDESSLQFEDNRPEAIQMRRIQEMANNSPQVKQLMSYQAMANSHTSQTAQQKKDDASPANPAPVQKKKNETGLPDTVKSGIENLSGYSMDDVNVHYNSDKPAQLHAHAFAQGTDIHIAPGQDKHLPHEAWHVVQQKQGRVNPTMQMKGELNINDDAGLENEADIMGAKAAQLHTAAPDSGDQKKENVRANSSAVMQQKSKGVIQRVIRVAGVGQTVADVTNHFLGTVDALTPAHTQILQTWSTSATIHNFMPSQGLTAWEKIPLALGRAAAAGPPPALFTATNLQFITQAGGGRLPTLYFSGGGQTGRLRQQHGSGPLAEVDPQQKTRISFANLADRTAYVTALRHSRRHHAVFVDPVPGTWNVPAVGQNLLEYYMAGGGIAGGWHPSEGLVQNTPPAINTDVAIEGIYNNIIGVENDDTCCCCPCFITTACVVSKGLGDECEELQTLREFRDGYLLHHEYGMELIKFYYTYSPAIVEGINAQPGAQRIYDGLYNVIRKCVTSIRRRDLEEAFLIYVKMVLMLKNRYAPEIVVPDYLRTILQSLK